MSIKRISLVLVALLLSILNIHTVSAKEHFVDVPSSYDAYDEIQYLVDLGAIKGYKEKNGTYYKPHNPVTRGQAAKMVIISKGLSPIVVSKSNFTDVEAGTELSKYVERAVSEGYISEVKKGQFAPYVSLTRQEMAKALALAFDLDVDKYANLYVPFTDITPSHPYYKYIAAIYYNGITKGSPKGKDRVFMPNSPVTRGQFASFIARAKEDKYRLDLPVQGVRIPNEKDAIGKVVATANHLNVRTSTDTSSNANRIGQIHEGDTLPLFEVQEGWFKVLYKDRYAYISSNYAKVVGEPEEEKPVETPPVKEEPQTEEPAKDEPQTEEPTKEEPQAEQPQAEEPVNEEPQSEEEEPVKEEPVVPVYTTDTIGRVTTASLNIRSEGNASSDIVGKLQAGDVVAVHSIAGNWVNITTADGTNGYVHKTYMKLINQSGSPIKDRVIVIDAGHGGKDPGASSEGYREKDIVIKVATILKDKLEADGAKVVMTRSDDTYFTLEERVQIALNNHAEVFVSLHVNSFTNPDINGTETYYSVAGNENILEEEELASAINSQIVKNANMYDRGVKKANFYVIKNMLLPSVLVELGFISNPGDREKLINDEYVEIFADSIYKGIVEYYQE